MSNNGEWIKAHTETTDESAMPAPTTVKYFKRLALYIRYAMEQEKKTNCVASKKKKSNEIQHAERLRERVSVSTPQSTHTCYEIEYWQELELLLFKWMWSSSYGIIINMLRTKRMSTACMYCICTGFVGYTNYGILECPKSKREEEDENIYIYICVRGPIYTCIYRVEHVCKRLYVCECACYVRDMTCRQPVSSTPL